MNKIIYNREERIGVYSVAKIFTEGLGWIFREQPISDFGIDGFVEITRMTLDLKHRTPTGRLIGVQIKSGKSFFKESAGNYFIYRGAKKHLHYWLNYSIPVIIVLYDKEANIAYWEIVNESTIQLTNKSFKINLPKKNILELNSATALNGLAIFRNNYDYKLWLLQASIDPIRLLLKKQLSLYVEIDSIPNSQDYHISLLLTDQDTDNWPEVIHSYGSSPNRHEYHFYLSRGKSLKEAITDMLPWADVFLNGTEFSDKALTELLTNEILRLNLEDLSHEDFVQEILALHKSNSFLILACYLTDSSYIRLEIKINALAHIFLEINNFLEKKPTVQQTMFL